MGAVTVTKKIRWAMAHRLGCGKKYNGACSNLHGHDYVAELTFVAEKLDDNGMVLDFGEIKRMAQSLIMQHLDHATIVFEEDKTLIDFLQNENSKHHIVDYEPTAEGMVLDLVIKFRHMMHAPIYAERKVQLCSFRLYETPDSWAEWRQGDEY